MYAPPEWVVGKRRKVPGIENLYGILRKGDGRVTYYHKLRQGGEESWEPLGTHDADDRGVRAAHAVQQVEFPLDTFAETTRSPMKFSDETWEAFLAKLPRSENTKSKYRSQWAHMRWKLNGKRVDSVTTGMVVAITDRMKRTGYEIERKDGTKTKHAYSEGALASVQSALGKFYSTMAPRIPSPTRALADVERYAASTQEPVMPDDILTTLEAEAITRALLANDGHNAPMYGAMSELAPTWALRISEMLAVRWDRIDWQEEMLLVDVQLAPKGVFKMEDPSTWLAPPKGSTKKKIKIREIPIPGSMETLERYRAWAEKNGRYSRFRPDGFLFCTRQLKPLSRTGVDAAFMRAIEASGIRKSPTFHQYRHMRASDMLGWGMNFSEIALFLGNTEKVTRDTYALLAKHARTARVQRYRDMEAAHRARLAS